MSQLSKLPTRRAFAALDDHGLAFVVIDTLRGNQSVAREVYPLAGRTPLKDAEDIAAEFNAHGSYIFRGGMPLTGAQIPPLRRASL